MAPWKVEFVPNPAVKESQSGRSEDFRTSLTDISVGTVLYNVVARRTRFPVGDLISRRFLRSTFTSSPFVDESLYFQHARQRWQDLPPPGKWPASEFRATHTGLNRNILLEWWFHVGLWHISLQLLQALHRTWKNNWKKKLSPQKRLATA